MAVAAPYREVEIKVAVPDPPAMLERLNNLGFRVVHARSLESNVIYDTPGGELRGRGELIRIRKIGSDAVFTYKGPATVGRHKEREEIELSIGSPESMGTILERLGYRPGFRYEKYRTELARPGEQGIVMLDETPVGCYLELEGPPGWIDEVAGLLGYAESEYINLSYARLYARECERNGIEAADMVFPQAEQQIGQLT